MKIYRWLFLCLLFSCGNEKETAQKFQNLPDKNVLFHTGVLLQHNRGYENYKNFVYFKQLLQISDTEAFTNDFEIRLYKFGGMTGPSCFRYTFLNYKWQGERIHYETSVTDIEGQEEKPEVKHFIVKDSIRPKYGWANFIKNIAENGLMDMPTNEAIAQEFVKLSKIYPEKADDILSGFIIDGGAFAIEVISKDHYDFRLYDAWELHNANEYKGLIMIERLNKLIKEMIIMKYETYP